MDHKAIPTSAPAPAPAQDPQATTPDTNRLMRIETRLVVLMRHLGLEANGEPLNKEPK
jgi:hypothetical protein